MSELLDPAACSDAQRREDLARNDAAMAHGITRVSLAKVSGQHLSEAHNRKDSVVGERFGMWEVIGECDRPATKKRAVLARCDCGTERQVVVYSLVSGRSTGCGCAHNRKGIGSGGGKPRHGHSVGQKSRTYQIWQGMRARCDPRWAEDFPHHAGKGITVCERWGTFENFLADMGEAPKGKSLDRWPRGDGNYEPGNCRWATPAEQTRNTARNVWLTYQGRTMCRADWSTELGISKEILRDSINRGATMEEIVAKYRDMPEGHRWCPVCKQGRPFAEFGINRSAKSGPDHLGSYCRACSRLKAKERRAKNRAANEPTEAEKIAADLHYLQSQAQRDAAKRARAVEWELIDFRARGIL